jgi:hypothetical protein
MPKPPQAPSLLAPEAPSLSTDIERGATILTAYAKREMKAYPIFETELDSIAFLNTLSLVFFSAGSALLSFAIGIWTNAAFSERLTPEAAVLSKAGAPALIVAAIVCYVLGERARRSRETEWGKIKGKSLSGIGASE